jgi:predicted transcriptional regulator
MGDPTQLHLSRRERQIMDVIYRLGNATAAEVLERLPDPPSYSAVRAMLRILEDKGYIKHAQDGPRYVYMPTVAREKARRSALQHLVKTFFDGSTAHAVAALLNSGERLSGEELDRLAELIEHAKREER